MVHYFLLHNTPTLLCPLDFDPDTSMGNIENRLQMLIMNARELEKLRHPGRAASTA